jgi:hypothetical protein
MAKKAKFPTDVNSRAEAIVDFATSDEEQPTESSKRTAGRAGAAKGGSARAEALTAERRSEIARKAAQARWSH